MYSISKQLTLLLICSLTLVVFSAAIQGYRSSTAISSKTYDDELKIIAQGLMPIALNWSVINPGNAIAEPHTLLLSKKAMPHFSCSKTHYLGHAIFGLIDFFNHH